MKKDPSYVARVLRLATLAPDITQAILDGREPDGLSYMKLVKACHTTGTSSAKPSGSRNRQSDYLQY
jgi:pyruvate/2-oxoacid:ferredoxin oxidoreductase beta subunit